MTSLRPHVTFAAAILVTGVLSGVVGAAVTLLIHAVQHLAYGYAQGSLLVGVLGASAHRRLLGPTLGCAAAGLGWWLLRRYCSVPELNDVIREARPLPKLPLVLDAALQVLAVGSGASLGREQAPRMLAAAGTDLLIHATSLTPAQRRILLGAATGAGLAAVYDVPVAGALFALGIVLRTRQPLAVLVALAASSIATVTAWPVSHGAPAFAWPPTPITKESVLVAIAVIPLAVVVGAGFTWLIRRAHPRVPPTSWTLVPALGCVGLLTGAASLWLPQLPGNGKSIVAESLTATSPLAMLAVAVVVKPVLTALFVRAGAVGGLITPALATGTATGAAVALAVNTMGGHASIPTAALMGGAAVLGVTQNAPLFAAVFTAELTRPPVEVCALLLLAALGAHTVRWVVRRRFGS